MTFKEVPPMEVLPLEHGHPGNWDRRTETCEGPAVSKPWHLQPGLWGTGGRNRLTRQTGYGIHESRLPQHLQRDGCSRWGQPDLNWCFETNARNGSPRCKIGHVLILQREGCSVNVVHFTPSKGLSYMMGSLSYMMGSLCSLRTWDIHMST